MNRLLFGCLLFIFPTFLFAHNPLSAKYYLEHNEKGTFLSIYLSQTGLDQALIKKYGQENIRQKTTLEYKELTVKYIKSNFHLEIDHQKIELLDGGIKLGNHQTDLKFILSSFAKKIGTIKVNIPAFQENDKHQTVFSYNLYGLVDKVILSERNNFAAIIHFNEQEKASISTAFIGSSVGVFALLLLFGLFVRNKAKFNCSN